MTFKSICLLLIITAVNINLYGQPGLVRGLLKMEIRDSILKELIIKSNYYKLSGQNKEKKENECCSVKDIVICPQENLDTVYGVFMNNNFKSDIDSFKTNGHFLIFNKNGNNIKCFGGANWILGEVMDINNDGQIECIDNIVCGSMKTFNELNYLYVLPISERLVSSFGIVYDYNWFWRLIDINNDSIFEVQIGPKINNINTTHYNHNLTSIIPKVTFFWSMSEKMYCTDDVDNYNYYRVIDFGRPYPKNPSIEALYMERYNQIVK